MMDAKIAVFMDSPCHTSVLAHRATSCILKWLSLRGEPDSAFENSIACVRSFAAKDRHYKSTRRLFQPPQGLGCKASAGAALLGAIFQLLLRTTGGLRRDGCCGPQHSDRKNDEDDAVQKSSHAFLPVAA